MSSRIPWSKYGGTPPQFEIVKARDQGHVPDDVYISPLPVGANMYSGSGIPAGSTVLSPDHLGAISFPLHPMIHLILFFTNTHPMQLNPNSYSIMSTFLALGLKLGVSLGFRDFLYLFDMTTIKGETSFFNFKPRYRKKFLSLAPTRARDWKNRPLLISGNWKAPELYQLSIPSTFGPKPGIYEFTVVISFSINTRALLTMSFFADLSEGPERILSQGRKCWLKRFLTRKIWSSRDVADTLTQITSLRNSIIYFLYSLIDRSLPPDPLLKSIFALDLDLQFNAESPVLVTDFRTDGSEGEDKGEEGEESGQSDTDSGSN